MTVIVRELVIKSVVTENLNHKTQKQVVNVSSKTVAKYCLKELQKNINNNLER